MDAQRWRRVSELVHAARAYPPAHQRAFVEEACPDDRDLAEEVASLLASDASHFLSSSGPVLPVSTMPGGTLSGYRIERLLGRGGMGAVFLAHDTQLHRLVAIKVLDPLGDDATMRERLLREARNAAALNHPNICTIHEVGEDGSAFIAMEYVDGTPLSDRIASSSVSITDAVRFGTQAADALAHAHEHGVVHRDFKAANLIVTTDGRVKIVDFGLARRHDALLSDATTQASLVPPGMAAGTPYAMAPEQVRGDTTDGRTDIWALGVLLYEMVSGRQPFSAPTTAELFSSILRDAPNPVPTTTPSDLSAIIVGCLEKDPAKRFQTASDVRSALERVRIVPNRARAKTIAAGAGVMVLLAAAVLTNLAGLRQWFSGAGIAPRIDTVAVLPLENLTGHADQEYLAAGMHEGLITGLAQLPGIRRVTARRSFRLYDTSQQAVPQIAAKLGVRALVMGSVQRSGERLRVSAQLIDGQTEEHLWASQFERDARDIVALQNDVVAAIARVLDVELTREQEQRLAAGNPVDPKTYEAYLRGMFHLTNGIPGDVPKGLAFLQQAIDADPGNPHVYAGLALGYATIGHGPSSDRDIWLRARAAAERAVTLNPSLAEAHAAMADVKMYFQWDYAGAERAFRRANELNPSLASNHYHWAWYHALFGRWDEAIAEHKRAQELDPLTALNTAWLGGLYAYMGRYAEALSEAKKSLELNPRAIPGWLVLGFAQAGLGNFKEAVTAHERTVELNREFRGVLALTYYLAGRREDALRIVRAIEANPTSYDAYTLVQFYAHTGDLDAAFRWASHEPPHAFMPWVRVDPPAASMRRDPRFAALMQRFNLPNPSN
jgi:TolB-like protein/predicted Ser/Thr protein kinase